MGIGRRDPRSGRRAPGRDAPELSRRRDETRSGARWSFYGPAAVCAQHGANAAGLGESPRRAQPKSCLGEAARRLRAAGALIVDVNGVAMQHHFGAAGTARAGVPGQETPHPQPPQRLARRSLRTVPELRQVRDRRGKRGVLALARSGLGQVEIPLQEHQALRPAVHGHRPSTSVGGSGANPPRAAQQVTAGRSSRVCTRLSRSAT